MTTLTTQQLQTLNAAILAETNATFVAYRNNGQTDRMAAWLNEPSSTDAWMDHASRSVMFEATDVTKFDGLTAGKRDAWRLLMDNEPIDFGRNANRKAVQDIWGNTDSVVVLQAMREKATRAQAIIGGTLKTTNTVSAIDRAYTGSLSGYEISLALSA
jgi:hypothetical protein